MNIGTIKWFNVEKGYGFIAGDDGKDIFVHISDIDQEDPINTGDRVSYDVGASNKGPKAVKVHSIS